jgi:hypothetical protein
MPYTDPRRKVERSWLYRQLHKDELNAIRRKQYHEQPHKKAWIAQHNSSLRGGYVLLRRNSIRGNYVLEISFEEYCVIVKKQRCFYCAVDLSSRRGHKLDRVNNKLGYLKSNVVPSCADCNRCKGVLEHWGWEGPELIEALHRLRKRPQTHCAYNHPLHGAKTCLLCHRKRCREATAAYRARKKAAPPLPCSR